MQHIALCTLYHSVHVLMLALMPKSMLTCGNMSHTATASFLAGSGLMDIGVGAFIFSSGISSKPAPFAGSVKLHKSLTRILQRNSLLLMLGETCLLHITPEVMSRSCNKGNSLWQFRSMCISHSCYIVHITKRHV